jgi:predicted PolB exonuclease-like 3'-5' exonuclease
MMNFLVFDIETAPSELDWKPPEDDPEKFPPLPAQRILCLSAMHIQIDLRSDGDTMVPIFTSMGDPDNEQDIIRSFLFYLRERRCTLVSWNGRRFDVPLLVLRSIRHGMNCSTFFAKDFNYRYSDAGHWDVADDATLFGAAYHYSLGDACQLLGLPGKMGIDGKKVWEYYSKGRLQEIVEYCHLDVLETACFAMRLLLSKGRINKPIYQEVTQAILDKAERVAPDGGYLAKALEQINREELMLGKPELPF